MNNKYTHFLTGHQKFMIRQSWLVKGINAIKEGKQIFSNNKLIESIDYLGIGSNMVQSLRYWLKMFNIVDAEHNLTIECQELVAVDPQLSDDFSKWLLHIWNSENSPIWQLIHIQDKVANFDKDYLFERLTQHLKEQDKNISPKTLKDLIAVFINLYCKSSEDDPEKLIISPLESLSIIRQRSGNEYQIANKDSNQINPAIVLYILANKNHKSQLNILEANDLIQQFINLDFLSIRKIIDQLTLKKHVIFDKSTGLNNITINNKEEKGLIFCWEYYHES